MRSISTILSAVLACAAAACANDQGTTATPSRADYDAMAQSLGTAHSPGNGGGDTGSMSDSIGVALGTIPAGFTLDAHGQIYGSRFGLDYTYSVMCTDAAGHAMPVCGAVTDSASVAVSWSGVLALPDLSASIDRTGDWTISTIQSGTATVDGHSDFTFDSALMTGTETRTWHLAYTSDYEGVRVQRAPALVVGGTIHDTIDASRMVSGSTSVIDATYQVDAEITFNPDGTADLVLDGDQHYVIAANGAVSHA